MALLPAPPEAQVDTSPAGGGWVGGGHIHRAQEGGQEGAALEGLLCTLRASLQAG